MAITVTAVTAGTTYKTWDVTWGAVGDTDATFAHGFASAPLKVEFEPTHINAYVGSIILGTVDATNITVTKAAGVAAGATVRVIAERPHSIVG